MEEHYKYLIGMLIVFLLGAFFLNVLTPNITANVAKDSSEMPDPEYIDVDEFDESKQYPSCQFDSGGIDELKSNTGMLNCFKYYDIFKEKTNQIIPDLDPLIVMAIAQAESSCNPSPEGPTKLGGLMQVDEVCLKQKKCHDENGEPLIEKQIEEGLKVLKANLEDTSLKSEFKGLDALRLVLFGYNRGLSARNLAITYSENEDDLNKAMKDACFYYYEQDKDRNGNLKCDHYGYAEQYPVKVLDIYTKACEGLDGTKVGSKIDFDEIGVKSFGTYSVTPNFKVELDYDITVYDQIYDDAKLLQSCQNEQELDLCVKAKLIELNSVDNKYNLEYVESCDEQEDITFNSFYEGYYSCLNSPDDNCYCDVDLSGFDKKSKIMSDKTNLNYELGELKLNYPKSELEQFPFELKFEYDDALDSFFSLFDGTDVQLSFGDSINSKKYLFATRDGVKIYKSGDLNYGVVKGNKLEFAYGNSVEFNTLNKCNVKKEIYRFCAKSDKSFIVKNKFGQVKEEQINYKFAIKFPDNLALEIVTDIKVNDAKLDEDYVILSWRTESQDIDSFRIMSLTEDPKNKDFKCCDDDGCCETDTLILKNFENEDVLGDRIDLTDYKLSGSNVFYNIVNRPSGSPDLLFEEGKLYKSEYNYYVMIKSDLVESKYYLITAKDKSGNDIFNDFVAGDKSLLVKDQNYAVGRAIDDLPPIKPKGLEIFADSTQFIVKFDKNILNFRGLPEKDIDRMLYFFEFDVIDEFGNQYPSFISFAKTVGELQVENDKLVLRHTYDTQNYGFNVSHVSLKLKARDFAGLESNDVSISTSI